MSTLAEIENAADSLSSAEKEELLRFLAMRLRKERATPTPRIPPATAIAVAGEVNSYSPKLRTCPASRNSSSGSATSIIPRPSASTQRGHWPNGASFGIGASHPVICHTCRAAAHSLFLRHRRIAGPR